MMVCVALPLTHVEILLSVYACCSSVLLYHEHNTYCFVFSSVAVMASGPTTSEKRNNAQVV